MNVFHDCLWDIGYKMPEPHVIKPDYKAYPITSESASKDRLDGSFEIDNIRKFKSGFMQSINDTFDPLATLPTIKGFI